VGYPLQTDLIVRLLLPLRLFLETAQKMNHEDTKAQRCLFISLINLHIKIESFVDLCLCGFEFESQCPRKTARSHYFPRSLASHNGQSSGTCYYIDLSIRQSCNSGMVPQGKNPEDDTQLNLSLLLCQPQHIQQSQQVLPG